MNQNWIHYDLIRRDRLTDGGGDVLICFKKNLVRSETEIIIESSNEIIKFIITLPEKKIEIIVFLMNGKLLLLPRFNHFLVNMKKVLDSLDPHHQHR
jgi:hypothetical protein